jgi:chromosomal replication initiation ATPase DnaA
LEQRFLGDAQFVEALERRNHRDVSPGAVALSLPEVCEVVARALDMTVADLRAPGRERRAAMARAVVAHVGQLLGGIHLIEAARAFARDPVTISLGVQRLRARLQSDGDLAVWVDQVMTFLRRGRARKYKIIPV